METIEEKRIRDVIEKDFHVVGVNDPLTKVSGIFANKDVPLVLVTEDSGKLYGIITERQLLKPHLNITGSKASTIAIKSPHVTLDEKIINAARLMVENNLKALPVVEDGKPIGIVTVKTLAEAVKDILKKVRVRDFMTKDPITILSTDTIGKAISLMRENGISRLPVLEKNKLVGIVTVHDIIEKIIKPRERTSIGEAVGEKAKTLSNKVKDIMSKPVHTISKDSNLLEALDKMIKYDISCLVVTEDKSVIGIVTMMDILEPLASYATKEERGITIQVSYKLSNVSYEDKDRVMEIAKRFVEKLGKSLGQEGYLTLYFKEHKEKHGEMHLIHCRARLKTDKYQFVGVGEAWRADFAARTALERIERQLLIQRELAAKYPYVDEILEQLVESY